MTGFGAIALVSLGSNSPDGRAAATSSVLNGRDAIRAALDPDARCSALFATPAFPAGIGPDFVNAAMAIVTPLDPHAILAVLHDIEATAGRQRRARWGPRTLDLDLLAHGDSILPDRDTQTRWRRLDPAAQRQAVPDRLILPHPRLQDRAFVLVPLAQVAPDWVHPGVGRSVTQMRDALPPADVATVSPLDPEIGT